MLELIGEPKPKAAKDAATVMRDRDGAREGVAHPRRAARPVQPLPQDDTGAARRSSRPPSTGTAISADTGLARRLVLNVDRAGVLQGGRNAAPKAVPLADWKAYLRWHVVHARAPYLSKLRARGLRLLPRARCAAWRRCRRAGSSASRWSTAISARRSARSSSRRTFTAETKAEDGRDDAAGRARPWRARSRRSTG